MKGRFHIKKAFTLLLTMLMLLSMAACGKDSSTGKDNPSPNNSADSGESTSPSAFDLGQYCQAYWAGGIESQLENDEWAYQIIHGDSGKKAQVTIYNYLGTSTSITIPDTIDGYPVTVLVNGYPRFAKNMNTEDITNIEFPDTLFLITSGMLDSTAWYDNQPDGPVYAGNVLYNYKGTVPDGTSFSVADGTTGITAEAFKYATGLTSLTMPDTVVNIESYAFLDCSNLEQIRLSKELRYLDSKVFFGCDSLVEIHIPQKIYFLHDEAFSDSTINKIYYEGDEATWNDLCDRSDLTNTIDIVFNQVMPD